MERDRYTQGRLDLEVTSEDTEGGAVVQAIDKASVAGVSEAGSHNLLVEWRGLTGYYGPINNSDPDAMQDLKVAVWEKASTFNSARARREFLITAAGPVVGDLFELHRNEYTRKDGSLDVNVFLNDVIGRLTGIFYQIPTVAAAEKWIEDHPEYFERPSVGRASQGISRAAVGAVVSN
ncbi:hypothetical protein G112A_00163 [Candidatus Nanosynsacchari sp. TM7_G1_3_12Alb]|nr:hypothetical protein G112A_00163 [Candidatus Nanosynsacchari sp. TM7_G1_3_12Alb]